MNAFELKLAKKNREVAPASWDELYENLIISKIRDRYSLNQELAILRQRDSKPAEFEAYNEYVERCKAEVKAELGMGGQET
jgi:hypothetical protein